MSILWADGKREGNQNWDVEQICIQEDLKKVYFKFLKDECFDDIQALGQEKEGRNVKRLLISLTKLRNWDPKLAEDLLKNAKIHLHAILTALRNVIDSFQELNIRYARYHWRAEDGRILEIPEIKVGFVGEFGGNHKKIRDLSARHHNNLIKITGMVTKVGLSETKLLRSIHYNPETKEHCEQFYKTDSGRIPRIPKESKDGVPLQTEFGLSDFQDIQSFYLQEGLHTVASGRSPRLMKINVEDDLVNIVNAGDNISVSGIFSTLPKNRNAQYFDLFEFSVAALQIDQEEEKTKLSMDDIKRCQIFKQNNPQERRQSRK